MSPRSRVDVAVPLHIHGEAETSQVSRLYSRTNVGEPIGDVETS